MHEDSRDGAVKKTGDVKDFFKSVGLQDSFLRRNGLIILEE